ncbi:hypothetical protein J6590_002896 [Homalodisca vitripennis]|nr:hypothetical protein J6590_002896 [Homalodisca vitripennis]
MLAISCCLLAGISRSDPAKEAKRSCYEAFPQSVIGTCANLPEFSLLITHNSLMFQEENEDKVRAMRKGFMMIDIHKTGSIETSKIAEALNKMGLEMFDEEKLEELIDEVDVDETGKVDFDQFCQIVGTFLEEEDAEAMQAELKEAFRLYDKEGNGYITTKVLREILAALDDALKPEDLDGMIAEIDTDGSGTVDFEVHTVPKHGQILICVESKDYPITDVSLVLVTRVYGDDDRGVTPTLRTAPTLCAIPPLPETSYMYEEPCPNSIKNKTIATPLFQHHPTCNKFDLVSSLQDGNEVEHLALPPEFTLVYFSAIKQPEFGLLFSSTVIVGSRIASRNGGEVEESQEFQSVKSKQYTWLMATSLAPTLHSADNNTVLERNKQNSGYNNQRAIENTSQPYSLIIRQVQEIDATCC